MATSKRYSRKGKRKVSKGRKSRKGQKIFTRKTILGGDNDLSESDLKNLDDLNGVTVYQIDKDNKETELYTIEFKKPTREDNNTNVKPYDCKSMPFYTFLYNIMYNQYKMFPTLFQDIKPMIEFHIKYGIKYDLGKFGSKRYYNSTDNENKLKAFYDNFTDLIGFNDDNQIEKKISENLTSDKKQQYIELYNKINKIVDKKQPTDDEITKTIMKLTNQIDEIILKDIIYKYNMNVYTQEVANYRIEYDNKCTEQRAEPNSLEIINERLPNIILKPYVSSTIQPEKKDGFFKRIGATIANTLTKATIGDKPKNDFQYTTSFIYLNWVDDSTKTDKLYNYLSKKEYAKNDENNIKDQGLVDDSSLFDKNIEYRFMQMNKIETETKVFNPISNYTINSNSIITLSPFGAKIQNTTNDITEEFMYLRKAGITNIDTSFGKKTVTKTELPQCYRLKTDVFETRVLNYYKSLIAETDPNKYVLKKKQD